MRTHLSVTLAALALAAAAISARAEDSCRWMGTAPACNGKCDAGYTEVDRNKTGDGKKCVTGTKAKCCLTSDVYIVGTAPACNGKCDGGDETLGYQDTGKNGNKCVTGKAAICRLPAGKK